MTELEKIEQKLYDEGIIVRDGYIPCADAMCLKFRDEILNAIIYYDSAKLDDDSKHIRSAILHEEMHLKHPETMYSIDDSKEIIRSKERRVNHMIFKKYIPQKKLFYMIYERKMELYEIADELRLCENLIMAAYDYYSNLESWINCKKNM